MAQTVSGVPKKEMNAYAEMKKRHQVETDALPMYWAFTEERFDEILKELGLTRSDTDKLCRAPGGGFCLASDAKMIADTLIRHRKELEAAIEADATGDDFIKDSRCARTSQERSPRSRGCDHPRTRSCRLPFRLLLTFRTRSSFRRLPRRWLLRTFRCRPTPQRSPSHRRGSFQALP